ncbi:MAG TPA: hypothetical protein PL163_12770, partial [Leptospiraceae bacterium]|nr:hypothetical protein [Leptospiraceae bacterium]
MNWEETEISEDRTHHLFKGRPLYAARFVKVLEFHSNGTAAVTNNTGSFHIDMYGKEKYKNKYDFTWGYYFGRAAVCDSSGAFHISETGESVYSERYEWCGNYQECISSVRDFSRHYFHIDMDGRRIY